MHNFSGFASCQPPFCSISMDYKVEITICLKIFAEVAHWILVTLFLLVAMQGIYGYCAACMLFYFLSYIDWIPKTIAVKIGFLFLTLLAKSQSEIRDKTTRGVKIGFRWFK